MVFRSIQPSCSLHPRPIHCRRTVRAPLALKAGAAPAYVERIGPGTQHGLRDDLNAQHRDIHQVRRMALDDRLPRIEDGETRHPPRIEAGLRRGGRRSAVGAHRRQRPGAPREGDEVNRGARDREALDATGETRAPPASTQRGRRGRRAPADAFECVRMLSNADARLVEENLSTRPGSGRPSRSTSRR